MQELAFVYYILLLTNQHIFYLSKNHRLNSLEASLIIDPRGLIRKLGFIRRWDLFEDLQYLIFQWKLIIRLCPMNCLFQC